MSIFRTLPMSVVEQHVQINKSFPSTLSLSPTLSLSLSLLHSLSLSFSLTYTQTHRFDCVSVLSQCHVCSLSLCLCVCVCVCVCVCLYIWCEAVCSLCEVC